MAAQENPPQSTHPEPLIIQPQSGRHIQTFIILHGRGSDAQEFGPDLVTEEVMGGKKLPDLFPNAKFIFPTAVTRHAKRFDESFPQWFDMWSTERPDEKWEDQIEGIRESVLYIHGLLETEVAAVGGKNVILWGISQGCATSLIALLLWSGQTLGAVIGMCGWLPLREKMKEIIDTPLLPDDPSVGKLDIDKVEQFLRKTLQLPGSDIPTKSLEVPVFLAHGTEDDMVPVHLAEEAEDMLRDLGVKVDLAQVSGMGHWYCSEMLHRIVNFICNDAGWPITEP